VVRDRVTYSRHTNSHLFMLCDDVWTGPDVIDVTNPLRAVENA